MTKRGQNFERHPRDYYPTPYEAVIPLLAHLEPGTKFNELCAGDGRLVEHLEKHGHKCLYACDIEPQADGIERRDILFFGAPIPAAQMNITNPPWERKCLHEMIEIFRLSAPTWLLFDSDWMFTAQAVPYLKYCSKIVSVGRISWMGNGVSGMDNCCWYKFEEDECDTIFVH